LTTIAELIDLCHALGEPALDLAIAAEGNASFRIDNDSMAIKASGSSLATVGTDDVVAVTLSTLLSLLDSDPTDSEVHAAYEASKKHSTDKKPSVEAILHAVLYATTNASVIAHTHPTSINAIGCSAYPELLVAGSLFPDAIVMLGRAQLLIPYTDPGVPLAQAVTKGVREFQAQQGCDPTVIYLANHGVFVLTDSTTQALQTTLMAVKNAKVLLWSLMNGGPAFLDDNQVRRIDTRPDELYRRTILKTE
jgi:rhamnose utilization protein RhaD (predicted bifunctional aldolase and dehydrogenase)